MSQSAYSVQEDPVLDDPVERIQSILITAIYAIAYIWHPLYIKMPVEIGIELDKQQLSYFISLSH